MSGSQRQAHNAPPARSLIARLLGGALPAIAMVVALLHASLAFATTTGALKGVTSDLTGLPIPGVTVTLSGVGMIGGSQERVSDANGAFNFVQLLPGEYELTAAKTGFKAVTLKGIQISVNRTMVQNITLPEESSDVEVVEVVRQKTIDVEDTTIGEVLTKDYLQNIPTGRDYQSAVTMAAGVIGYGNPNMAGAGTNENTYMLDGANITDPVTGTFSVNFNYDAIQQIEVVLGGYMPEYGVSLGGIINLVTESGTNNLEFLSSFFYLNGNWGPRIDGRFTADGFELAPSAFDQSYRIITVSGKVSGPVVRDKAWFIVSYEHARSLIQNIGIDVPRDYDAHYVLAKLTVQPSSEHRFTTFIQLDPTVIDNTDQTTQTVRPEAQGRQAQGGVVTQARWQWFLTPDANLDTAFVFQKSFIEVGSVPCTHNRNLGYHPCEPGELENNTDWTTPGRLGSFGAYDSVTYPYFTFDDRFRYQASTKLNIVSIDAGAFGTHDIGAGVEVNQTVWDTIQGYTGNVYYVDLNLLPYDPQTLVNWYAVETTGPIKYRTTGSQWSTYIQDAWKVVPNLTLKGGARFDRSIQRNDLGEPVVEGMLLAPRAYFSWDPFGDQKSKVSGGYGRFNDSSNLGVASFVSGASYGFKLVYGEINGEYTSNNQALAFDVPRGNDNVANENLLMPRVDELLLIVERELIPDVAIRNNLVYKMTRYLFEYDELNVIYDEDGSAIIGSRFSDPFNTISRLRTPQLARRNYIQYDLTLDKLQAKRWSARLTWTYANSLGTSQSSLSGSFANDPQSQYNYGPQFTDRNHVVKAFGYWQLPTEPWDQTIGFLVTYYSGAPLERFYYSEKDFGYSLRIFDRGIYTRWPGLWEASVKFNQDIDVRRGTLQLQLDLLNMFNFQTPDSFWATFYSNNRMLIASRQDPLQIQLGVRYEF
jgi:hypothetical protein